MTSTENFITLRTFTYNHELVLAKMLLESENIECYTKDELTVQAQPFYSNAIGGIKLQVKQSDFTKATEILKNGGYLKDEDLIDGNLKLHNNLERITSGIGLLNKLKLETRLIVIALFLAALLLMIFLLMIS